MSYYETISCDLKAYFSILSEDWPDFLEEYLELDLLQRLKNVGLFCGCDYTSLFTMKQFYSRFDHSVAVALIIWHFTHDKKQTIAGLLHDVSSPAFSHVVDFLNEDYLVQESTEEFNREILKSSKELHDLLNKDSILFHEIEDYKRYPIADNPKSQLSADRLEYTFSTKWIMLEGSLDDIQRMYQDIRIVANEKGDKELGFQNKKPALCFVEWMNQVNHIYLSNENKLALQFIADILKIMIQNNEITLQDLYTSTEEQIISKIKASNYHPQFIIFNQLKEVRGSEVDMAPYYCRCLEVKRRYIDPLLNQQRISLIQPEANALIEDILSYKESRYAYIEMEDFVNGN